VAQPPHGLHRNKDGNILYTVENNNIIATAFPSMQSNVLVSEAELTPAGQSQPLHVRNFFVSNDEKKLLIYSNSKKVWRYDRRGDYWVLKLVTKNLKQLGKGKPASSLMFTKFWPDGNKVAYVCEHYIYVEDLNNNTIKPLTTNGYRYLINGTFDWVYEEKIFCRDGFRWSPDGTKIAYWQLNAKNTPNYLMINNTDSAYPFIKPVEYPIAGIAPSPFKIGVVDISTAKTNWMNIPTDPVLQSYVPRMEWANNSDEIILQHLNRKQNVSDILLCNIKTGQPKTIYHETDSAWLDVLALWDEDYSYGGWDWLNNGKAFMWASEQDG
jgi:dipeptidyl-peptidase-4